MAEPSRQTLAAVESVAPAHVLIVEARFYDRIGDDLLAGARAALEVAGATHETVTVLGALEIPSTLAIVLDAAAQGDQSYDAAIALGCIMRGDTYHFEIVANESARGIMDLSVARGFPIGNAILTVENEEQAAVRADPARGDKGGEAVRAALAVLRLKRRVEQS